MSQELLAERAGLSPRTISDLERGVHRTARRTTVNQLVDALDLTVGDARELHLLATAAGRSTCQPLPPGLRHGPDTLVVGRDEPLSRLEAAADTSRTGRGGIVVVTGDSGIGKTRLACELAGRAASAGDIVLHGRIDGPESPPLRALRTALADLVAAQGASLVAERAGWAAPQLASLLPELRPIVGPPATIDHRSDLFDATLALLRATFKNQAGVIVLDDISWADDATWAWIDHVGPMVSDLSLLLVVVARTGAVSSPDTDRSVRSHLALLGRLAAIEWIELHGLDDRAVSTLVRAAGIGSPAIASCIVEISQGNPLLVDALSKQLAGLDRAPQERLLGVDANWPASPARILALVDNQLDALAPATAHVVEVASLIGPDIDTTLLAALVDLGGELARSETAGEPALDRCLDEAAATGILEPIHGDEHDRWTFRHPLLRMAAADRMGPASRAALHHAAGVSLWPLDAQLAEGADVPALAAHLLRGLRDGADPRRALLACRCASAQAGQLHAWEAASAWLGQAVAVARRLDDKAAEAECLLDLGNARIRAVQRFLARPVLLDATELALESGRLELIGPAAEGYARMTKSAAVDPRAEALWRNAQTALAASGTADAVASTAVLTAIAIDAALLGDPDALALSEELLRLAEVAGPATYPMAATTRAISLWPTPRIDERLELANRLVEHADRFQDDQTLLDGLELRGVPLLQQGHVTEFDLNVERLSAAGRSQHHRLAEAQAMQWRAMRALMVGDIDAASRSADQAVELAGDAPNFAQGWAAQQFVIQRLRGQHHTLLDRLAREAADHPEVQAWTASVALTAAEAGEPEIARGALERLLAGGAVAIDGTWTRTITLALCAEAAWLLDDGDAAALLQPLLSPYDGQFVVVASGTSCEGAVSGYLGLLAATLRKPERATCLLIEAERLERQVWGTVMVQRSIDRRNRIARST